MDIIWIDKKSVLTSGKKKYRSGDVIPSGILTAERLDFLVEQKKIRLDGGKAEPRPKSKPEPKPEPKPDKKQEADNFFGDSE